MPDEKRKRTPRLFVIALLTTGLILGIAFHTLMTTGSPPLYPAPGQDQPVWGAPDTVDQIAEELESLNQKLEIVEGELASLTNGTQEGAASDGLDRVNQTIDEVQARIASLEQTLKQGAARSRSLYLARPSMGELKATYQSELRAFARGVETMQTTNLALIFLMASLAVALLAIVLLR